MARAALLVRNDAGEWQERLKFPSYRRGADDAVLEAIGADGQTYVGKPHGADGGREALYRYDLATGKADDAARRERQAASTSRAR